MEPLEREDPQAIGRYRLVGRLGSGGMGRVYLALSTDGRVVAIKVIHRELVADPMFRSRFRREVDAARRVSGAYTAAVMDADAEAELPWLATVYVPGPSLRDAVRTHGPLPVASVRTLAVGLAAALREVHRAGLVHRDLTPANVLLTDDGPRVIDFGITKAIETGTELTGTGVIIGSPGFMSPEQVEGRDLTSASDVFSFGAALFFAAVGTGPFGKVSSAALLYRVVHTEPLIGELPSELRPIVAPCLARQPELRPTPEQLLDLLGSVRGGLSWLPGPVRSLIEQQNDQLRVLRDGTEPTGAEDADVTARVDRATASGGHSQGTRSHPQAGPGQPQPVPPPSMWVDGATPVGGAAPGSGAPGPGGGAPMTPGSGWGHVTPRFGPNPHPSPIFGPPGMNRPRRSARYAALTASLIILVAVVVVSLIALTDRGGAGMAQGPGDPSVQSSAEEPASTEESPAAPLPGDFVGEWTGYLTSEDSEEIYSHVVINLEDGGVVGGAVGTVLHFESGCDAVLELTAVIDDDTVTLAEAVANSQIEEHTCPQPETTTLTLDRGLMYYETTEPALASELSLSLDEVPEELHGAWSGTVDGARYGDSETETTADVSIEILAGSIDNAEVYVELTDGCHHASEIVYADPFWLAVRQIRVEGEGCPTVPAREVLRTFDGESLDYFGADPELRGQLDQQ
ncbi:protein kinase family protein [Actinoalloteichus sp. GBA129-24]|uniref:Protein kinase family protein n=2 Tax=Pseudonocardiaceae TaxID=2070 RepID=A0AAC9LH28_9PSEU|nr:protein kinase family protein [Actinoalloteichus fjordicus]APU23284.1 protein kinase family protein [Actinoalloteichus sp. GBA129-24]